MIQIVRCDQGIDTKLEYEITNLVKVAFEKRFDNYERCKYISDFMDTVFGGCWRVIIGTSFRTCGTFYCQQLIRLTFMGETIEIFKTQGDTNFEVIEKDSKLSPNIEESILQSINSAQSVQTDSQYHPEYIAACLHAKFQGEWAVISGFDYNCRIPYVHNNYISVAVKGIRYTVMMIAK